MTRSGLTFLLAVALISAGCSATAAEPELRVLFVGNSYTTENSLPTVFAEFAEAGGHPVEVGVTARGAWSLADHVASESFTNALGSRSWDVVVLQEQSVIPSLLDNRERDMYPAGARLSERITGRNAQVLLFMTWSRQDGLPVEEFGFASSKEMQKAIEDGYLGLANLIDAQVAPVGRAWANVRSSSPLNLYDADGSHPNEAGTYLAAAVFYASMFQASPLGINYHGNLDSDDAEFLQRIAAETVLSEGSLWFLSGNRVARPDDN